MTDLRNKAAALGANAVQHGQPQLGVSPNGNAGSITTSATVVGTVYRCPHGVGPGSPPPEGAGGFTFGQTAGPAQAACESSGHQWSSAGDIAACNGTAVAVGFPGKTSMEFCAQTICKIDIALSVDGTRLQALLENLEREYGPVILVESIPESCIDHVEPCLRDGRAKLHLRWEWPDQHTLEVIGDTPPNMIALRLSYTAAAWAAKHKALPTL